MLPFDLGHLDLTAYPIVGFCTPITDRLPHASCPSISIGFPVPLSLRLPSMARRFLVQQRRWVTVSRLLILAALQTRLGGVDLAAQEVGAGSARAGAIQDGLWYGFAVGGGGIRLTCDLCDPAREIGPAVDLSASRRAAGRTTIEAPGRASIA
jgi:hypothetical protein